MGRMMQRYKQSVNIVVHMSVADNKFGGAENLSSTSGILVAELSPDGRELEPSVARHFHLIGDTQRCVGIGAVRQANGCLGQAHRPDPPGRNTTGRLFRLSEKPQGHGHVRQEGPSRPTVSELRVPR